MGPTGVVPQCMEILRAAGQVVDLGIFASKAVAAD
jgi:hypothetical protein